MRRHLLVPLAVLLTGTALSACSEVQDTANRAQECVGLARDAASAGLDRTPTVEDAEAAARRLDDRVAELDDEELKESAGALRDRLRELAEAARSADPARAQQAADAARQAARDTAETCGVPVDQFLG